MLGVLKEIFGGDRVAGALGVAGELQVFFRDVMRGAADLHLGAIRFVNASQRIVMMAAPAPAMVALVVAIASPHALVLTVSHGFPVHQL